MKTEYTWRNVIDNVNSVPTNNIYEKIVLTAKIISVMKPDRVLADWETFHPSILSFFILTDKIAPIMCYTDGPDGRKASVRIDVHLANVLKAYSIEQFLDIEFTKTFVNEYLGCLVKLHNDSTEMFGRSIFGEWRTPWRNVQDWVFNKIEVENAPT